MNSFKKNFSLLRVLIIVFIIILIFSAYLFKMLEIGVVNADVYRNMVSGISSVTQPLKAVRGEVFDRNGKPIVQNEMKYNIVLDKAFLPRKNQNDIILMLISLFEKNGAEWSDPLPITKDQPYEYIENMRSEIDILKSSQNAQSYTSAADMMFWLNESFGLKEYSPEDARKIAGVRYGMVRQNFSLNTQYTFAKDVSSGLVVAVKERNHELTGVDVKPEAVRSYPDSSLAPHIIGSIGPLYKEEYDVLLSEGKVFSSDSSPYDTRGYTLDDTIGKSGVEKAFEEFLRGNNGLREIQLDGKGGLIKSSETISPIPGNKLVLTIDSDLQLLAQESLEAQIKHLSQTQPAGRGKEAHSGAVVVLNPKTGELLAAATYPSYSLEEYKNNYSNLLTSPNTPLVNRAILGQYTPGSIFKPATALAGLHSGTLHDGNSTYFCTGTYHVFSPYTPKCLSTHGRITLNNAIGWSCNIFFYETGRHAGIDAIDAMAKSLGLGEPTGIEIDEAIGQRSNPQAKALYETAQWSGADTIQTAIGQMYSRYSPLQLANYAATIANRGKRMKITLLHEVRDYYTNESLKPFEPVVEYEMTEVSDEYFETTINGMINATGGSAGGTFGGYPITVASKTGTPQVTKDVVNSTFIAFAPADDPQIAVAVVIEEGWQGYTGAPVAKAIFDEFFGIEHRGAVASGPQRLEDYRLENNLSRTDTQSVGRDINYVFSIEKQVF